MYNLKVSIIFVMFIVLSFIAGCIEVDLPSACDSTEDGPSIICSLKDEFGLIRPEGVGNLFIVANSVAINKGLFTKADLQKVVKGILFVLENESITYAIFSGVVNEYIGEYPGLLDVAQDYLKVFNIDKQIYPKDLLILRTELNRILLNM